jgi:hypothetical protein
MSKYVKNNTNSEIVLRGLPIPPQGHVVIPAHLEASWARDENVASRVIDGSIQIKPNEQTSINGYFNQMAFLLGDAVDVDGSKIVRTRAFSSPDGFRFRGCSFSGNILANSTQDIDFKIVEDRYLNGGMVIVDNLGNDDKLTFQVVDKDNILGYGPGVILDEFIKDYFIPNDATLEVALDYPAKIIAGLYLRLKYTSTHESGCRVKCNLYLHWRAS